MLWLWLSIGSALGAGIWTLLLKRDLNYETNTQLIALYPLVGVILLPIIFHIDFTALHTLSWLFILKTASVAVAIFAHTLALKYLPVSIYAPLRNISPLFLLIFGALFLGEMITAIQVVGLFVLVISAVLLDVDIRKKGVVEQIKHFFRNRAVLLLILSAISISFTPLFDRFILYKTDPYTALFFYQLMLLITFWIVHIIKERKLPTSELTLKEVAWIIATGVTITIADVFILAAIAIPGTILVVLIGIRRLSNLFATVLGGRLFKEEHLVYKGVMCLLMILGTVLLVG